jgi:thiamine kinase-like enzyme
MGDRYFDLGNLAANNGFSDADDEVLLDAYWPDGSTPRRLAALRLMRVMSDFREGMWGVVQAAVSELEFDFAGYAREHLGRVAAALAGPRLGAWLEAARG